MSILTLCVPGAPVSGRVLFTPLFSPGALPFVKKPKPKRVSREEARRVSLAQAKAERAKFRLRKWDYERD